MQPAEILANNNPMYITASLSSISTTSFKVTLTKSNQYADSYKFTWCAYAKM